MTENNIYLDLWKHRKLIIELAKRELTDRFVGQLFGSIWIFIHPIFQISVLIFLYSFVFKSRLNLPIGGDYTAYILSGLIPWLCISDSLSRSTNAIRAKASLVKQVIFPIQVLPVVSSIVALVPQFIGLVILLIYSAIMPQNSFNLTILALPALLIMQMTALIGVSFFLSTLGVYFRDIKDIITLFVSFGTYLSPIVYFIDWVPEKIRFIIYLNPITHIIFCYQDVLFYHDFLHVYSWLVLFIGSIITFFLGRSFFNRTKPYFGSAL
ncbi:MAG: ABC transporter permease [Pseudobdellovibrio sp.]